MIVRYEEHSAVLTCSGDEDRTTQAVRRTALSRAGRLHTDLVVDLSDLSFADASLMLDLAMLARRLRKRGQEMLLSGAQPQIHALIELVGLHRLPGVRVVEAAASA